MIIFKAVNDSAKLDSEVESEYDKLASKLIAFMKSDGRQVFAKLTKAVLPCQQAYAAYNTAIGVTCGEAGAIHRLLGFVYVLALNILFVAFLYLSLYDLSFIQGILIYHAQNRGIVETNELGTSEYDDEAPSSDIE